MRQHVGSKVPSSIHNVLEPSCLGQMAASTTYSGHRYAYSNGGSSASFTHGVLPAEHSQYGHRDQNLTPNTPSLTTGSTRSTTSSISTCGHCQLSSYDCQCLSHSDSESVRYQQGDGEYVPYFSIFLPYIQEGVISFGKLERMTWCGVANFYDY
jgi:hypothetical protein